MHRLIFVIPLFIAYCSFVYSDKNVEEVTAKKILGNPDYQSICYGGYRTSSRDIEPTVT